MRQPEIWGEAFFGVCLYYFATLLKRFTDRAGDLGFAVDDLVWLH